jgi:2'-5' RNA ligase
MPTSIDVWLADLDQVIGRWRLPTIEVARRGVAPHVSLLFPWEDAPVPDSALQQLTAAIANTEPFTMVLDQVGRFPGVLWVGPSRDHELRSLAHTIRAAFPQRLPYGGQFPEFTPHVTVARGTETELDLWETELRGSLADLAEPLLVDTVVVAQEQPSGHWAVTHRLSLGRPNTP